jgi:hypothetical protein
MSSDRQAKEFEIEKHLDTLTTEQSYNKLLNISHQLGNKSKQGN